MATFGSAPVGTGLGPSSGGLGGTTLRSSGTSFAPVKQPANTDAGLIRIDMSDPLGSIGESAGNVGDMIGGLAGGALGLLGQVGIPGGPNLGDIPEAIGDGLGAVGGIGIGGMSYGTNAAVWGETAGGGEAVTVGSLPGALMDAIGAPVKELQRNVALRRAEASQNGGRDWLSMLVDGAASGLLQNLGLGALTGAKMPTQIGAELGAGMPDEIPQDILDLMETGEMTAEDAADELVLRGAGFSSNPAANLVGEIVFDPLNLVGGVVGKGTRLAQQAGVAVSAGKEVNAVNRFVGATYNAATHGLTAAQQQVVTKLAGPATAGVAQAIGPAQVRGTINAISSHLGDDLSTRFEDALAAGNAHYLRSSVAHSIAQQVRKGVSRAAEVFKSPEEVNRLIDETAQGQRSINPKAFIRDVEDYARRTLPTVVTRDETLRKVAAITGATVDDAAAALGKSADDLATQQTVHLAYWGHIADRLAEAKKLVPPKSGLDIERLTPIAPDTLTDQRAQDIFKITQDDAGKTIVGASDDEIRAAVNQFAEFAKYRGDAYDQAKVVSLVKRMWEGDYLPQTLFKDTTRTDTIPKALGDLRAEMNEFGYELGFGPEAGWRTLTDDAGEVIQQSPFVAVSSAKDPLTVRNHFGRFMDNLFRGITQERIVYESRARLAQRVAKYGINEVEAKQIHERILSMSRELRVAPRGLAFGGERQASFATADGIKTASINRFDQAFLDTIGEERFVKLVAGHDPTTLIMQAFEGNLATVGLSQKVSGGVKSIPLLGRGVASIAEVLYPMVKFKYNAMFQAQEMIESPFLNMLRGVDSVTDEQLARLYKGLLEGNDEFRWLSGAEYTLNTAGEASVRRSFGDNLIGRLAKAVPDVQGMKKNAEIAQIASEHPEAFRDAIVAVNPRFWAVMEEAYGTTDIAAITKAFVKERAEGTGSLQGALRQIDEALGAAPSTGATDTDYAMETIWNAFRQSARTRAEQAFRTHYFSASRSFFERSINHPFLGLYPASYMFGKVLPEFARFLLFRPFGRRAPLVGMAALQKVQEAYVAQLATDPGFAEWIKEHPDAINLATLLIPGSPTDIASRSPAWAANFSEKAGSIKNVEGGANLFAETAGRSLRYAAPAFESPITMAKGVLDALIPSEIDRVNEALENAAAMYDGMYGARP